MCCYKMGKLERLTYKYRVTISVPGPCTSGCPTRSGRIVSFFDHYMHADLFVNPFGLASHRTSRATSLTIPGAVNSSNPSSKQAGIAGPISTVTMNRNICAKLVSMDKIDRKKEGGKTTTLG